MRSALLCRLILILDTFCMVVYEEYKLSSNKTNNVFSSLYLLFPLFLFRDLLKQTSSSVQLSHLKTIRYLPHLVMKPEDWQGTCFPVNFSSLIVVLFHDFMVPSLIVLLFISVLVVVFVLITMLPFKALLPTYQHSSYFNYQLMENLIPFAEKRRPPKVLRRIHSMNW